MNTRKLAGLALATVLSACAGRVCDSECLADKGLPVPVRQTPVLHPALDTQISGCVVLSFVIQPDGKVAQVSVVDAQPRGVFEGTAMKSLGDWRYQVPPADKAGRWAQGFEYRIPGNERDLGCRKTPGYDELNRKKD